MQTIDFLPEWYKVGQQRRHAHYYRLGAVGLVVLIIGGSTYGVELQKQQVQSHIQVLKLQAQASGPPMAKLAQLQETCRRLERQATLLTLLQCETPVSTVLAEIANRTPAGTVITQLTLLKRTDPSKLVADQLRTAPGAGRAAPKNAPADDLTRLRRRLESQQVQVEIHGVALNNLHVVHFVSQLDACPWIARAVLLASRPYKDGSSTACEFQIRVELVSPLAPAKKTTGGRASDET